MTENLNEIGLKYECIEFWKEFMLWIAIMITLAIIMGLIVVIIYFTI